MKTALYSNTVAISSFVVALLFVVSCSDEQGPATGPSSSNAARILVSFEDKDANDLASAQSFVFSDGALVQTDLLTVGINNIAWRSQPDGPVILKVTADGYEPFIIDLTEHTRSASPTVIAAVLKPAVGLDVTTFTDDDQYLIELDGYGSVAITWPDGTVERGPLPLSVSREFDAGSGKHILIKGDIQNITSFRAFGYNGAITAISGLKHLQKLQTFLPGMVRLQRALDLHHNKMLKTVDLFEARLPDWLILPQQHHIDSFTLALADRQITSSEIDMLIGNIFKNVVRRDIHGGTIALTGSDSPSADALDKIRILEERFQWNIDLNL